MTPPRRKSRDQSSPSSWKGGGWGAGRTLQSSTLRAIRRRLLHWYDRHRRDLPWRRRGNDPYAQWVAEIMLQQTRVETVAPYYKRFLTRFPTVEALAEADFQDVLKHWEGLGYYRRILHLHQAARQVASRGGVIPETVQGLRELPGIGEYTAAAIASIAFDQPAAAVDGNVARVLSRLFHLRTSPTTAPGRRAVGAIAESLLPSDRPGDFNQAWMDLGSMICTPRDPKCPQCPLEKTCHAATSGEVTRLPVRAQRAPVQSVIVVVGLFQHRARMLIRRRATGGLWSGLWEFPNVVVSGRQRVSAVRHLAADLGLALTTTPTKVALVRHQLTHRSIQFEVYLCPVEVKIDVGPDHRWVSKLAFEKLAVSTAHRRIHAASHGL